MTPEPTEGWIIQGSSLLLKSIFHKNDITKPCHTGLRIYFTFDFLLTLQEWQIIVVIHFKLPLLFHFIVWYHFFAVCEIGHIVCGNFFAMVCSLKNFTTWKKSFKWQNWDIGVTVARCLSNLTTQMFYLIRHNKKALGGFSNLDSTKLFVLECQKINETWSWFLILLFTKRVVVNRWFESIERNKKPRLPESW